MALCFSEGDFPYIGSTHYLVDTAKALAPEMPCLWYRGILPSNLCQVAEADLPIEHVEVFTVNANNVKIIIPTQDIRFISGNYYGDASGGIYSSYPKITRCGCGLVQVSKDGSLLWSRSFNLPGAVQTVPGLNYM